jgi:signal transduction histidine kinase
LQDNPHIDEVIRRCPMATNSGAWAAVSSAITGLTDSRQGLTRRDVRTDHSVVDCTTSPLPDGATLVTFADVTANVNAELFLQERNEALETAARVKNDFIKNVSYELRTPLQSVTMTAEMLADETVGPLNPKQKDYAQSAKQSADALLALMNDIFDLASLDAGALELSHEQVDPAREIAAVAATLSDRLVKENIILKQDVLPNIGFFEGDPRRIRQIVFNLVANAIGFSSPGQTITVAARRDDNSMILTVRDEGRGIPEEVLARIFERFESHTNGSNHRGVGLGLSMVKAFVELHNGTVHLTSAAGQGTIVTCRFPLTLARPETVKEQDKTQEAA